MTTTNDSPQGPKQTPKIKSEAAGGAKPDSVVHSPASQQDFHSQDEAAALPAVSTVSKKFGNVNAITHGVYSCGLRPWERQEDFDNLREDIRKCWKVKGAAQEETAFDIAYWTMMKRRALQASQISFFRSPVGESLKSGETTWDEVVRHQAKVPEEHKKLVDSLYGLVKSLSGLSDTIGEHHYWTNTQEGKDIQLELARMRGDVGMLSSRVREDVIEEAKRIGKQMEGISNLFDQAYQPEEIERQARLLSMINREIDKATKQMIYLKTFDDIESAKETRDAHARLPALIESPPVIPGEFATEADEPKGDEAVAKEIARSDRKPTAHAAPEHRGKPKAD